jgi:hypothetical protein
VAPPHPVSAFSFFIVFALGVSGFRALDGFLQPGSSPSWFQTGEITLITRRSFGEGLGHVFHRGKPQLPSINGWTAARTPLRAGLVRSREANNDASSTEQGDASTRVHGCAGAKRKPKQDTLTRPTSLETLETSLTRRNGRPTVLRKDRVEIRYFG